VKFIASAEDGSTAGGETPPGEVGVARTQAALHGFVRWQLQPRRDAGQEPPEGLEVG
jgi:hypothetical protein